MKGQKERKKLTPTKRSRVTIAYATHATAFRKLNRESRNGMNSTLLVLITIF